MTDRSPVTIISSSPVTQLPSLPHCGIQYPGNHVDRLQGTETLAADSPRTQFGLSPLPSSPSPVPSLSDLLGKDRGNSRRKDLSRSTSCTLSPTRKRNNRTTQLVPLDARKSPRSHGHARRNTPSLVSVVDKIGHIQSIIDERTHQMPPLADQQRRMAPALQDDVFRTPPLGFTSLDEPSENMLPHMIPLREIKQKSKTAKPVKSRKSSKANDTGNKVLKGRVSKPICTFVKEDSGDSSKIDLASGNGAVALDESKEDPGDLRLVEAVKRRSHWTPTKDTCPVIVGGSKEGATRNGNDRHCTFGDLLDNFRFNDFNMEDIQRDIPLPGAGGVGPTKRRRIQLVSIQENCQKSAKSEIPPLASPVAPAAEADHFVKPQPRRSKSTQKRPRTITAHVTAQYAPQVPENESLVTNSSDCQLGLKSQTSTSAKTAKRATKKRTKKYDAPVRPHFVVLSPETATRSLANQNLVFGTCSQLERDDSPTMSKQTQLVSELPGISVAVKRSIFSNPGTSASTAANKSVSRFMSSKSLWAAAARDQDGSTLEAETTNLSRARNSHGVLDSDGQNTGQHRPLDLPRSAEKAAKAIDGAVVCVQPIPKPIAFPPQSQLILEDDASYENSQAGTTEHVRQPSQAQRDMPNYNDFTLAELSDQIAKFGFNRTTSRKKMIALLEKCWNSIHSDGKESRLSRAQLSMPQSKSVSEYAARSSLAKEGTKRKCNSSSATVGKKKTSTTSQRRNQREPRRERRISGGDESSTANSECVSGGHNTMTAVIEETFMKPIMIDEIEDSEEELILSPMCVQKSRYWHNSSLTSSLALKPSHSASISSNSRITKKNAASCEIVPKVKQFNKEPSLQDIASQITKAIRAQPKMPAVRDSKRPTWHEKILLYDPIVLEDLAVWLNTEGLALVGEDREVHPGVVREWCESKGICCCNK